MGIYSANKNPQAPDTPPGSIVTNTQTGETSGQVGFTDPDHDSLTYSGPATGHTVGGGTITVNSDGTFTYVPTADQRHAAAADDAPAEAKVDTFSVTVSDGHGSTQSVSVTVTIDPANAAPQAPATPPASIVDHSTGDVSSAVGYVDPDQDSLTYGGYTGETTGAARSRSTRTGPLPTPRPLTSAMLPPPMMRPPRSRLTRSASS